MHSNTASSSEHSHRALNTGQQIRWTRWNPNIFSKGTTANLHVTSFNFCHNWKPHVPSCSIILLVQTSDQCPDLSLCNWARHSQGQPPNGASVSTDFSPRVRVPTGKKRQGAVGWPGSQSDLFQGFEGKPTWASWSSLEGPSTLFWLGQSGDEPPHHDSHGQALHRWTNCFPCLRQNKMAMK